MIDLTNETELLDYIENMSDEELSQVSFGVTGGTPWQSGGSAMPTGPTILDPDGFSSIQGTFGSPAHIRYLQRMCWLKFQTNPQIRTAILDRMGRVTGEGFDVSSEIFELSEFVRTITTDPRNRLYLFWPKYYARSDIEGELFLSLTLHKDGFVEVDFLDPGSLEGIGFHPTKPQMPLFYKFRQRVGLIGLTNTLIPSIFIAYYPELWPIAKDTDGYDPALADKAKKSGFSKVGGFNRFVVQCDKTMITARNVSHLATTLEWINHYENMKKFEIDHKKSCGAYVHSFGFTDKTAFKTWIALSDEERSKTGVMQKLEPGSRLFLPVGMTHEIKAPQLPKITDSDNDLMMMVTSGLNQPQDQVTGQSTGTYASVKASRGPASDRMSDESTFWERFMRYDFWRPVIFLSSVFGKVKKSYKVDRVIGYTKQKPEHKKVDTEACELLDFSFPTSAVTDPETVARALLGVKHGSVFSTLGIPLSVVARRLGFGNYKSLRLRFAEEEEQYPTLAPDVDQEATQEKQLETPKTGTQKPTTKPASTSKSTSTAPRKPKGS
jgi:hypothetical protein